MKLDFLQPLLLTLLWQAEPSLQNESLELAPVDCSCERPPSTICEPTTPLIPKNEGARIFYLVGIHNQRTLDDAVHLFRAIRDARNTILIHIDVKFDFELFQNSTLAREIETCSCGSHVESASIHNATWSSWSMNLPTFWGMKKAVQDYAGTWDVFINLSGDSLPVYTPDRIAQLFGGPLKGINFVTSSACETGLVATPIMFFPRKWHKRRHYQHRPISGFNYTDRSGVEHFNEIVNIHFASQWMTLQPEWVAYLLEELERPDSLPCQFRDYLIETEKLMTDETFISSLLMHLFPETTPKLNVTDGSLADVEPKIYAIRYERMDEHVPNSQKWFPTDQRYDVAEASGVEQPRPWGPYFLGTYDLKDIKESGALFIRKVSDRIDHNMVTLLPVHDPKEIPSISWPNEVNMSTKPDWKETMKQYFEHVGKTQNEARFAAKQDQKQYKDTSTEEIAKPTEEIAEPTEEIAEPTEEITEPVLTSSQHQTKHDNDRVDDESFDDEDEHQTQHDNDREDETFDDEDEYYDDEEEESHEGDEEEEESYEGDEEEYDEDEDGYEYDEDEDEDPTISETVEVGEEL